MEKGTIQTKMIFYSGKKQTEKQEKEENPLRNADNRISHNFHGVLVNQKAAYMFTYAPMIDTGSTKANKQISKILGNRYAKICKKLCVNASNCGIAWLHFWTDEQGNFKYGVIDSRQIIPVWTDDQESQLAAVLRSYNKIEDNGKTYIIYEIWTDTECSSFAQEVSSETAWMYYSITDRCIIDLQREGDNIFKHDWGRIPFIPFFNNDMQMSDLENTKPLIVMTKYIAASWMT